MTSRRDVLKAAALAPATVLPSEAEPKTFTYPEGRGSYQQPYDWEAIGRKDKPA